MVDVGVEEVGAALGCLGESTWSMIELRRGFTKWYEASKRPLPLDQSTY